MNLAKIETNSINNGPGFRVVVWCQGCSLHCPGCHNQETWEPDGGTPLTSFDVYAVMDELQKPQYSGITFTGGHPLEDYNIKGVLAMIRPIKAHHPDKTIWLYTGLTLSIDDIQSSSDIGECLRLCDVVVDGPFIQELRDITLPYRGSSNQRLIDIKKSLENNKIVEWE